MTADRKRTTPDRRARSEVPTPREIDLLADLVWAGYLSTTQSERLYFPSRRRAQRRMRALFDHGLVRAHLQAGALERENVYTATPRALDRLIEAGIYDPPGPRLVRLPRVSKLAHGLAAREVFVAARLWERSVAGRKIDVSFEAELARLSAARVVPDLVIDLRVGDRAARVFVEVDLGTETSSTVRAKLERWARSDLLANALLLFVCDRPGRLASVQALVASAGIDGRCRCSVLPEVGLALGHAAPDPPAAPPVRSVRQAFAPHSPEAKGVAAPLPTAFRARRS